MCSLKCPVLIEKIRQEDMKTFVGFFFCVFVFTLVGWLLFCVFVCLFVFSIPGSPRLGL